MIPFKFASFTSLHLSFRYKSANPLLRCGRKCLMEIVVDIANKRMKLPSARARMKQ